MFPSNGALVIRESVSIRNLAARPIKIQNVGPRFSIIERRTNSTFILNNGEIFNCVPTNSYSIKSYQGGYLSALLKGLSEPTLKTLIRAKYNRELFFPLSYSKIFANSKFSASYIEKFWNVTPELLFPPVSFFANGKGIRNGRKILSVGRFMSSDDGHSKNQLDLVDAFKLLSKDSDNSFELHLVGGVDSNRPEYFKRVSQAARGQKIFLHPNADIETLKNLYKTSGIYWHGAGFGVKENEPQKMEHFGITVVEAISAGLLPLVHDSAGPAEVLHDFPELRYRSMNELADKTLAAHQDISSLNEKIKLIPALYSEAVFEATLSRIIQDLPTQNNYG
jgi:glycosyltransferase involved in cell wall biosynthesis